MMMMVMMMVKQKKTRGDHNWLWLPTCKIRLMQQHNKRKSTCGRGIVFHKYQNKSTCGRENLGSYKKTKKDKHLRPEIKKTRAPAVVSLVSYSKTKKEKRLRPGDCATGLQSNTKSTCGHSSLPPSLIPSSLCLSPASCVTRLYVCLCFSFLFLDNCIRILQSPPRVASCTITAAGSWL